MCFHFFYTVQVDTIYQKVLYNSCLFLVLRYGIQKTKKHILHKWGFIRPEACNIIKKETLAQVSSCEFLRAPILTEHLCWLLLESPSDFVNASYYWIISTYQEKLNLTSTFFALNLMGTQYMMCHWHDVCCAFLVFLTTNLMF